MEGGGERMSGAKKKNSHGGKGIWGEGARGKKINVRIDPSLSFLGSSVNDLKCFCRKNKNRKLTEIFNFQFLDPLKTEKLSHAADCNIVGKAKLRLSFIFLFIVDRIEVKI